MLSQRPAIQLCARGGQTPSSPLITLGPMLVTVVPARTAKFPADPRNTALCCWAMAIGQRLIALRLGTMERAVRTPAYIAMWATLFDKGIPYLRGLCDKGIPYLEKAIQPGRGA